jgi:hypothetical protein
MEFTLPHPTKDYLSIAEWTPPTMAKLTASFSSTTCQKTQFTVESHHPTHTIVRLTVSDTLQTIPHNVDTRHNIAWFSKVWSEADRKRAPFYLEADTLLCMGSGQMPLLGPLYAFSPIRFQLSSPPKVGEKVRKRTCERIHN